MKVLLLNVSCEPLRLISLDDAISRVYSGDATIEGDKLFKVFGGFNSSGNRTFMVMSYVIRSTSYDKSSKRGISFNRKLLFIRDNHTCAYCNRGGSDSSLTRDHIIPKAVLKHKKIRDMVPKSKRHLITNAYIHGWENSITSCRRCNHEKGHSVNSHIASRKAPVIADLIYLKLSNVQRDSFGEYLMPFLKIANKIL